ncbi:hypothetical protein F4806DRAFT_499493 [Annulohypoxylon nitens]|nr:hypothetical protein F4806DRAFT_499493 [Annulohypoxylon nitens]
MAPSSTRPPGKAHRLIDQLNASSYERVRYRKQADQIQQGGPLQRSFQILFNTSKIGLGPDNIGVGKRSRSEQSRFKSSLIDYYDAAITDSKKPKRILYIHDTATGQDLFRYTITAAHLVPHSLGDDIPKDYKWKIIDPEAQILDEVIEVKKEGLVNPMTIRDIESRKLSFKNSMRPRAKHLHFLFALAQLKQAWRQEYR